MLIVNQYGDNVLFSESGNVKTQQCPLLRVLVVLSLADLVRSNDVLQICERVILFSLLFFYLNGRYCEADELKTS